MVLVVWGSRVTTVFAGQHPCGLPPPPGAYKTGASRGLQGQETHQRRYSAGTLEGPVWLAGQLGLDTGPIGCCSVALWGPLPLGSSGGGIESVRSLAWTIWVGVGKLE